jgi:arylsulfatase A-like enzyme
MTNQYLVRFDSLEQSQRAREQLSAFTADNGQRLIDILDADGGGLYFGCGLHGTVAADSLVTDALSGKQVRFGELLYMIDALKSGCHHPQGALWVGGGKGRKFDQEVSILDVYPTLLDMLGVPAPAGGAQRGASLLPLLAAGPTARSPAAAAA